MAVRMAILRQVSPSVHCLRIALHVAQVQVLRCALKEAPSLSILVRMKLVARLRVR